MHVIVYSVMSLVATWYLVARWYSVAAWYFVWFAMSCNMNHVISDKCGPSVPRLRGAARRAQARCSPDGDAVRRRCSATAMLCNGDAV